MSEPLLDLADSIVSCGHSSHHLLLISMSFKNVWHWMTCLPMLEKCTGTSSSQEGIQSKGRRCLKLYFFKNALWTDQCDLLSVLWSPRLSLKPPNIYSSTNTAPRRAKVTPQRRSNVNETLLSKQMWRFCIYCFLPIEWVINRMTRDLWMNKWMNAWTEL